MLAFVVYDITCNPTFVEKCIGPLCDWYVLDSGVLR
jgi:hypothetical protein